MANHMMVCTSLQFLMKLLIQHLKIQLMEVPKVAKVKKVAVEAQVLVKVVRVKLKTVRTRAVLQRKPALIKELAKKTKTLILLALDKSQDLTVSSIKRKFTKDKMKTVVNSC